MYSIYNNSKTLWGLLIIIMVSFTSCKKDGSPGTSSTSGTQDTNVVKPSPSVLVAGYESNGTNNIAKYWVDGKETILTDGSNDAMANSIFVYNNTTYITGTDGGPVFWKDGTKISLPKYSAYVSANSISVSAGNIYVAGTDTSKAVYWHNGEETVLDNTSDSGSSANSVCVSGSDVYIAGTRGYNAVYWKNGTIVYLTGISTSTQRVKVNSIAVLNGNAYVVGSVNYSASPFPYLNYWAGGVSVGLNAGTDLTTPHNIYGYANSVFASADSIYIAGMVMTANSINNAVYWESGRETVLPTSGDNSFASAIFVSGKDIYVAGYEYNTGGNKYAVYWKNGVEVKLTDGTNDAQATSIVIK